MKVSRIIIKNFQQFELLDLDLTDPNTDLPLDKVCLIGRNGTGKSTLLRILREKLLFVCDDFKRANTSAALSVAVKVETPEDGVWLVGKPTQQQGLNGVVCRGDADKSPKWPFKRPSQSADATAIFDFLLTKEDRDRWLTNSFPTGTQNSVVIFVPPDASGRLPKLPQNSLDDALRRFKEFPRDFEVSTQHAGAFWSLLIYHIKQRDADWQEFLRRPENRSNSVEQVEHAFEQGHPEILAAVADLWNRILGPAGLEFDHAAAKRPVQLRDNLEAFVKVKSTGERLGYNVLSSGIRNFLFRLGYIFSLYFGRNIEHGFLLLDEPENSLFPDFLYDQVAIYESIIQNTQFFTATHSPIIAAQFRPEERIILDFDESFHVQARRGITPLGDDPNDILEKDFEVRSIYGPEGIKQWERFLELRRRIKKETNPTAKRSMIDEFMQIGHAYNFSADAVPQENA